MTAGYLWGIIATIGFLAFTLALKVAELTHRNKLANDELTRIRAKLDALNDEHNKQITDSVEHSNSLENSEQLKPIKNSWSGIL